MKAKHGGALELNTVTKRFGDVTAVDGVDLEIQPGEFFCLLGPSGSGKTTILRMIAGFEHCSEGAIVLDGKDVGRLPAGRRDIGVVFQSYALFPHMTVQDNVAYGLKVRGIRGATRTARVREVLALVDLEGYERRRPRELSGGQQQRVAVARALAFSPSLLLMDEPLGALDRGLRRSMERELRRIHQEVGTTVVYVTHDQEEALTLSDRVCVLRSGRIEQLGSATDLYEQPDTEFVARFFGECNILTTTDVRVNGERSADATLDGTRLRVHTTSEDAASLMVRPERLRLHPREGDMVLEARLVDALYLGDAVRLTARHERLGTLTASADPRDVARVQPGDRLTLAFAPADAVLVAAR